MASQQQIEDDGAQAFLEFIRERYPLGGWNNKPYPLRSELEEAFDAGYLKGRKDAKLS